MRLTLSLFTACVVSVACAFGASEERPAPIKSMKGSPYQQEARTLFTAAEGVTDADIRGIAVVEGGGHLRRNRQRAYPVQFGQVGAG